jgi:DNA-binding XRE family transcriptional regulator
MNTRVWPKDKLLLHPPELPMDERIRRYQHNLRTVREAGFEPFSCQVDSLDEDEIRAWFEAGERRVASLKRVIRFVASLPVDDEGYAIMPDHSTLNQVEDRAVDEVRAVDTAIQDGDLATAPVTKSGGWQAAYLSLCATLRNRREVLGMTQDALAKTMGVDRRTVQRWEAGEVDPPGKRLFQWAGVLGIKISASDVAQCVIAGDRNGFGERLADHAKNVAVEIRPKG